MILTKKYNKKEELNNLRDKSRKTDYWKTKATKCHNERCSLTSYRKKVTDINCTWERCSS